MNRNKLNEFGERNEMGGSDAQQTYMVRHYRHHRFVRIARIAILILFLAVWEVAADTGLIDSFFFSSSALVTASIL